MEAQSEDENPGEHLRSTPGYNCGATCRMTLEKRAKLKLSKEERELAIILRWDGWDWEMISIRIGKPVEDIQHALANARTRLENPTRATLNVSPEARRRFEELHKLEGESVWHAFNRLMGIE